MIDLYYENYKSLKVYSLSLGWLCFSIEFKYTIYKFNK